MKHWSKPKAWDFTQGQTAMAVPRWGLPGGKRGGGLAWELSSPELPGGSKGSTRFWEHGRLGSHSLSGWIYLLIFLCPCSALISPGSAGHVTTFHPPLVKWPRSEGLLTHPGRGKSNMLVPSLRPRQNPAPTPPPPYIHRRKNFGHGDLCMGG